MPMDGKDYGFQNPKQKGYGADKQVGGQGEGGKRPGGKVAGVSNPQGMEPTSHGSKSAPLGPQKQRGGF